ncbi:QueT transporter family protein [Ruminococcus sp. AM42-11]|uniref:QueT transporter family protein n=1 Tax=Ruminococcus sp. AM42-11 TaxID=2292372 RepID=UPI0026C9FC8A
MKNKSTLFLVQAALIAAVYVVLTLVFAPFSYGEIQVRISEALTILPFFTPAAIPGLFVGCILANLLGGAIPLDIAFGSIATLIGAVFTYKLRNSNKWLAPVPPIVANAVLVPFVLRYGYSVNLPIPLMMLTVGAGEIIPAESLEWYFSLHFPSTRIHCLANRLLLNNFFQFANPGKRFLCSSLPGFFSLFFLFFKKVSHFH